MTERLAEIQSRIGGIRQLGAVVSAMRGIAAARAQQARGQLAAVESYASTIAAAIGRVLASSGVPGRDPSRGSARLGLVVFAAEEGFAGAFSERILNTVRAEFGHVELFMIGTRGSASLAQEGIAAWSCAMPTHSPGIPNTADRITETLYARITGRHIDRVDVVWCEWHPEKGLATQRRHLLPFDLGAIPRTTEANPPILNLSRASLLFDFTADYLHAQLCRAGLQAFAAENEARMEAMQAARSQVDRKLTALEAAERRVRQEEITAEIIELAAGETASNSETRDSQSSFAPH